MSYPRHLNKVIAVLSRLPGVGKRTAERYAFQMLGWQAQQRKEFAETILSIDDHIQRCNSCGCLCDTAGCTYCVPERKVAGILCVIADAKDVFAIESTGAFRGQYHVLGGLLSPVEGIDVSQLNLAGLFRRIESERIQEIVLALDATLEGDTTALFLKEKLTAFPVDVSRLAFGLPMGSAFDYIDSSTLSRAFTGRNPVISNLDKRQI